LFGLRFLRHRLGKRLLVCAFIVVLRHASGLWNSGMLLDGCMLLVVELLMGNFAGLLVDTFWCVFLNHKPALDRRPAPAVSGFRQGYSIGDLDAARHVLDHLQQRNLAAVHLPIAKAVVLHALFVVLVPVLLELADAPQFDDGHRRVFHPSDGVGVGDVFRVV